MKIGALIDYHQSVCLPNWRTEITAYTPKSHFVDEQQKGPYALWHHTHTFEDLGVVR